MVSQVDGQPLRLEAGGRLVSPDGTRYAVTGGIADLLDPRLMDNSVTAEIKVFQELPIERVPYFRRELFREAVTIATDTLGRAPQAVVEIGGGEGYLAQSFADAFGNCASYVCDVSQRSLANAGPGLHKIRCDARRPYLAHASMDVAAFWVSLHHFHGDDMRLALKRAVEILKPGGVLLIFEPNEDFIVRRLFYRSILSRLVYFDEQEKGVRYSLLAEWARSEKLDTRLVTGRNPPYNIRFLRHFSLWPLFYLATESLRFMELLIRWFRLSLPPWSRDNSFTEPGMVKTSLYLLTLFIKR